MNNNRVEEIKKEDKKAFKGFAIVIVLSAIVGAIIGFVSAFFEDSLSYALPNFLIEILLLITPFVNLVLSVLLIIVSFIIYSDSRKKIKLWNQSDEQEEMIDKIEERLSYLLLFTAVTMIIGFFFFGTGVMLFLYSSYIDILLVLVEFILCIISCTLIQNKVINLEKEINPMLKGSIYDVKFTQKWLESCDEAIKLNVYKSTFKSYKVVSTTCLILEVVCIIGYSLWDFGIMPLLIVTIIWLAQTISYCLESIKCSKNKNYL